MAKANKVLLNNMLFIANTLFQQPMRQLYTWTSIDGQFLNQFDYVLTTKMKKLYTVTKNKSWSSL